MDQKFLLHVEKLIEQLQPKDETFRLWLVLEPDTFLPQALLQNSIKG